MTGLSPLYRINSSYAFRITEDLYKPPETELSMSEFVKYIKAWELILQKSNITPTFTAENLAYSTTELNYRERPVKVAANYQKQVLKHFYVLKKNVQLYVFNSR